MSEPHTYGLRQPGHITFCTHCGAEKPPYTGQGGVMGIIRSIDRWADKHTKICPNSPLKEEQKK